MPAFPLKHYFAEFPKDSKGDVVCNKDSNTHQHLTPGVGTVFCAHGVCLGFKMLAAAEGPSTIGELLATRFPGECCLACTLQQRHMCELCWCFAGVQLVIYDNSCNLHVWCMKRFPTTFKDTTFMVDRLHWYNHKRWEGC
jgi:hypothetical protein